MKKIAGMVAVLVVLGASAFGQGTILWNEAVNGPLSQDFSSPTSLSPFQAGTNSIIGMTEVEPVGNNWFGHPDFFAITIPNNLNVKAVYLTVDRPEVWAWIGDPTFFNQLGFIANPSSGELLVQWGLNSIGAGNYGMYMNNHDQQAFLSIANYRLNFVVQAIPEPASLWLLVGGVGFLGIQRWRKSV